jgi:hypothetical protein
MAITVSDLKFFLSERMTQEDDAGGRMSAVEIAPNSSNGVFVDISDVARAAGSAHIAKIYSAVTSTSDDQFLDAGVVIFKPPTDPNISVLALTTGGFYDERSEIQAMLQSQIVRGSRMQVFLWGGHIPGQRSLTLWGRPTSKPPGIGDRIDVAEYTGTTEKYAQTVWITRVSVSTVLVYDMEGAFSVTQMICEIAEGLRSNFTGDEPTRYDIAAPYNRLFESRYNSGAVPLYSVKPLVVPSETGSRSVKVESLYTPLIPTAFAETAMPDATPGGGAIALVEANTSAVTQNFSGVNIATNASLYVGSPIYPDSLSMTVGGATITDKGGALRFGGNDVGTVDYNNGVLKFNELSPTGTSATVNFKPAAVPIRVTETAQQIVTGSNRGFVWVLTLRPLPAKGSLQVAYRVNNEWYVLLDDGAGVLSGVDSSYGTGSINYVTGTVTVTTGALPDVGSSIMYAWTTYMQTFARGGDDVDPIVISGTVEQPPIMPGSFSITWDNGNQSVDDSIDSDGTLATGEGSGGEGWVDYATGNWFFIPSEVPIMGTEFSVNYSKASPDEFVVDEFNSPPLDGQGQLIVTPSQTPVENTIRVTFGVELVNWMGGEDDIVTSMPEPSNANNGGTGSRYRNNIGTDQQPYWLESLFPD